jgi:hypothetical protein
VTIASLPASSARINALPIANPYADRNGSTPGVRSRSIDGPVSLRVFGRLPVTGVRGCTQAGVRKASKEETAGEFAPRLVPIYGEFAAAAQSDLSVPDRTTVE